MEFDLMDKAAQWGIGWVFLLVIAIIGIATFIGYKKGLIKIVLSMISIVVTLVAVSIFTPIISDFIKENTSAYEKVCETVEEHFVIEDVIDSASQQNIIDSLEIPAVIKDFLKDNNTIEKYEELGVQTFNNYIVSTIADVIFNMIVFAISFVIVFIAIRIIFAAINLLSKLPVINEVNKVSGTIVGFVEGVIIVWVLFAFVTMLGSTEFGKDVFAQINANPVLSFIYSNNLIVKYLLHF